MRIFAIGDIHGSSTALRHLLAGVKLTPADRVVTLGDYINKGPDSKGVLDQLVTLSHTGQLIALRGNHELRMLTARTHQMTQTKDEVLLDARMLASYAKGASEAPVTGDRPAPNLQEGDDWLTLIPTEHWAFVADYCRDWWESDAHIFAHANLDPQKPLHQQSPRRLFWEKFDYPAPHQSGKTLVCGHTRQKSGNPLNIGHAICIDTWAWGAGWLTGLEVNSGEMWQVNRQGKIRRSHIDLFYRDSSTKA
ncbi:MAG: metallophosphoesterase family protein [Cyanobacteria bacterium P01_A01_bin.105]